MGRGARVGRGRRRRARVLERRLDALLWDQRDPGNPLRKTLLGRLFFREQVLGCLRAQLLATAFVETHPEVLSRDLGALAVVTGHPRTSSTALHHALCAHPDATCLRLFEALNPVRPEGGWLSGLDLRELVAHVAVSSQAWMRPLFALMFPFEPRVPFEEIFLTAGLFSSQQWVFGFAGDRYASWYATTDHLPAYQWVKAVFQVMDAQAGRPARPVPGHVRILKSPQHMINLPAIKAVFPHARLIMTNRKDLVKVAESLLAILSYGMGSSCSGVDPKVLGRLVLRDMRRCLDRFDAASESAAGLLHVHFEDFCANSTEVVERTVRAAGLRALSAPDMQRALQSVPKREGATAINYDLAVWGVSREQAEAAVRY